MSEDEFVAAVTEGQNAAPAYFPYSAHRNRERHPLLGEHETPQPLGLADVLALQEQGGVVLDTRSPADFAAGHLRGSINVSLVGRFAEYARDVIEPDQPIVLVCEPGHELEGRIRLGRIGFDNVVGALDDPIRVFSEHPEVVERSSRITASELTTGLSDVPDLLLVDVRGAGERALGTIDGSLHIPLPELTRRIGELDPGRPTVVFCAGGNRSSTAASVLAAQGFADVSDLLGGYQAWATTTATAPPRES